MFTWIRRTFKKHHGKTIRQWIQLLDRDEEKMRSQAMNALMESGHDSAPALARALRSGSSQQRRCAVLILQRIGLVHDDTTMEAMYASIFDEDPQIREAGAEVLIAWLPQMSSKDIVVSCFVIWCRLDQREQLRRFVQSQGEYSDDVADFVLNVLRFFVVVYPEHVRGIVEIAMEGGRTGRLAKRFLEPFGKPPAVFGISSKKELTAVEMNSISMIVGLHALEYFSKNTSLENRIYNAVASYWDDKRLVQESMEDKELEEFARAVGETNSGGTMRGKEDTSPMGEQACPVCEGEAMSTQKQDDWERDLAKAESSKGSDDADGRVDQSAERVVDETAGSSSDERTQRVVEDSSGEQTCPVCKTSVVPARDGTCFACGNKSFAPRST